MKNKFFYLLGGACLVSGIAWLNVSTKNTQNLTLPKIVSPANEKSNLPRLRAMQNGDQLMSWVEPQNTGHALKFAVLHDGNWVKKGIVVHGQNWFLNWADSPSVVSIDENFWVAHWLVKQSGGKTFDYDVVLAISNDSGNNWREIGHPHQDKGKAAEHGFATIFSDKGEAGIVWLDGRDYVKKQSNTKNIEKSGNFNLRYTRIHRDGSMEAEQVLDNNTCTCCWTSVAVTPLGAVAAWRGRTDDEIRDNRVAVLRDGIWSAPKPLGAEGWHIAGCPVNGPSVSARGMQVAAAWFTAAGDKPRVRAAFSADGGLTFGKPIEIDDAAPLGRIGLIWQDDKTAIVSWMTAADSASKHSNLALRSISTDGKVSEIKRLARVSGARDTGVPQIAATGSGVLLAWTGAAPEYGIKTQLLPWGALQSDDYWQRVSDAARMFFTAVPPVFSPSMCVNPH